MNIHEYQAKALLKRYGVPVPNGRVIYDSKDATKAAWSIETEIAVVKAQIHAGGRGKAGGVKIAHSIEEVEGFAKELLGNKLITHQTGPKGREVRAVLIEEGCAIHQEYYLAFTLDRAAAKVALIASSSGGMDIEEVAKDSPEKIIKAMIDPLIGLSEFQARSICFQLNMPLEYIHDMVLLMKNLYRCFMDKDCLLLEINPLVTTKDHRVIALDAKMNFDENGLFRNQDLLEFRDFHEEDEKETEASQYGLSYISLDGNIGCMVNGAGLAMGTMDMIKFHGGNPANFLDVGGSASEEKVTQAFRIILSDEKVQGIFVNIFGGIMKCDIIAKGIVNGVKEVGLKVPLVVRLEGTNVEQGKEILEQSNLNIVTARTMGEGAEKIVRLIQDKVGA